MSKLGKEGINKAQETYNVSILVNILQHVNSASKSNILSILDWKFYV